MLLPELYDGLKTSLNKPKGVRCRDLDHWLVYEREHEGGLWGEITYIQVGKRQPTYKYEGDARYDVIIRGHVISRYLGTSKPFSKGNGTVWYTQFPPAALNFFRSYVGGFDLDGELKYRSVTLKNMFYFWAKWEYFPFDSYWRPFIRGMECYYYEHRWETSRHHKLF